MMDFFAFPLTILGLVALVLAIFLCRGRKPAFLKSWKSSCAVILLLAAFLAVEGTWSIGLYHNPAFWALCVFAMLMLGMHLSLSHLGLLITMAGTFFSAPDFQSAELRLEYGKPSNCAISPEGLITPLPFTAELKDFSIERYDDGVSPKQYSSTICLDSTLKSTCVNHPCLYKGYLIYQADYDKLTGRYSVLHLVRDPWLPLVLAGMAVLAAGCLVDLRRTWRSRWTIPASIALAFVFTLISLARINLGTLPPALRSLWFIPHLIIYMLAYSLLALSVICGIISLFRRNDAAKEAPKSQEGKDLKSPEGMSGNAGTVTAAEISSRLLRSASSLLALGMLCGAVWAKMAWGDYWTWDPKECWAAATWMITLAGIHLPARDRHFIVFAIFAFVAMQLTWYGVNYLPSASESMHTYNSENSYNSSNK